ncbi:uncharacterized protein LOC141719569 [Apium graveolens]|uniref:uncharacterized protein LOC141719569 n=1 Tax=Apium graveolens TaxID=4045 RepID=UPI003D7ADDEB
MDNHFTEGNTELLLCIGSLDPRNSFSSFNNSKLVRLAQFYPEDFSILDLELLPNQLDNFIYDVRTDKDLSGLQNIGDLCVMMVKTHRHTAYPLVYLLVKLAPVLPVATATVERVFSSMKTIKTY